jgi:hypothetical protein
VSDDVTLHPVVAALAATMVRSADKKSVSFPLDAVEKAAAGARTSTDPAVVRDLIALAVKIKRIAGDGGLAAIVEIGLIVAEKLGSTQAAGDQLEAAGVAKDAAALLGKAVETRAPRSEPTKPNAPNIKAKRGLR